MPAPRSQDLRLLPAAALGWVAAILGLHAGALLTGGALLGCLAVTAAAAARLRRAPAGRHRRRTHGRSAATAVLAGATAAALLGWSWARAEARGAVVEPYLGSDVVAVLRIDSEPRVLSVGRVLLRATWIAVGSNPHDAPTHPLGVAVSVLADASWMSAVVGERVHAAVRVVETERADAAAALLVAEGGHEVVARAPPVAALVASLRAGLVSASSDLDAQARGLVPGIALGDDRLLPATLEDDLRTVSLTHVTAVSGAHVAMVLGLVLLTLRRLPRAAQAVLGAVVLVALVALVHPAASVLRSATMGGVLLVGLLLGRPRAALPALWASIVVLLAVDPWLAGSFGFVLSVLATSGLLIGAGPIADRLTRLLPRPAALALAVPMAAQLACAPALALLQPAMPVHGVLANVMAAPAVPPATILGLVATLVAPFSAAVAHVLAAWAGVATAWVATVAIWCAALPLATLPWWLAVLGALLGLLARAVLLRSRAGRGR
ncbi:ComEC/Rec2 family competence protein [Pseudactinotalea terrae]|uniref:ComEC/Rec2 family competence protein n=1 Tax=Pseudactinotalea terrae TaxID=1743262 RepID=UPI0012E2F7F8|nr:ComEC/Rec2 family competence protein [Pseudactinotalea terrae]